MSDSTPKKNDQGNGLMVSRQERKRQIEKEKQRRRAPKEERAGRKAFDDIEEEITSEDETVPVIPSRTEPVREEASPRSAEPVGQEPAPFSAEPAGKKTVSVFAEPVKQAPLPAPAPPAPRSEPYRPSVYAAEPARRSARPSDAEVREFLDAFKRGDFLNLAETEVSNPPVQPDERFYMGGSRVSTIQYDGKEVDMSADENYRAPQSQDSVYSYAREEDAEEEPDRPSGRLASLGSKVAGAIRGPQRGGSGSRAPKHEKRTAEPTEDRVSFDSIERAE